MRGISARSLDEVLAAVDAAQGPAEGTADGLGPELFGVVAALDAAPALRRVLTDPSTEAEAKSGLAATIFGGKISDSALTVLQKAVSGRWAAGRDLTDGLEIAGVAAVVATADAAGDLDAVETELFEVGQTIATSADLRQAVSNRAVPAEHRLTLLTSLFGSKVSASTLELVRQAAVARTGSFEKALAAFSDLAAARRQRLIAEVRVAAPLGDAAQERLSAALAAKYGREVHLNTVIDPEVVGGIAVSVGPEVVDGTMSSRLELARRRLAG